MGKVLILYKSDSGNTEKLAEFVAQGAKEVSNCEIRMLPLEKATGDDIIWCDGLAFGTPTHYGAIPWEAKKWWDDLPHTVWSHVDGKFACSFSSSGSSGGGSEILCMELLSMLLNFGFMVFGVTDYATATHSSHYGAISAAAPEKEDYQQGAVSLGRRLAEWVSFYVDKNEASHPLKQSYARRPADFAPKA